MQRTGSSGIKMFPCHFSGQYRFFVFIRRIHNCQESAHYHVVDFSLFIAHMDIIWCLLRRNDGMVVADFCIIDKCRFLRQFAANQWSRKFSVNACIDGLQTLFDRSHDICGQITGIRSRISQDFMIFIQPLHDIQCFFCRKAKFLIRFPLQLCQIV